ncbi:hypothetical protein [Leisingera daeponensis]|uniref:hypothetical protein n=1 Tax=Leisingera daeponensis TaxID=405746 RepID=UPI001C950BE9|nr:hypothetical protein [Leisingera daeponensis]MBY6059398.1 hypothetical protein [Leisingera daeponensis]
MRKAIKPNIAAELVPDGARLMIGGFMGVDSPHRMSAASVARGVRELNIIASHTLHKFILCY